jgi:hypothetical protein
MSETISGHAESRGRRYWLCLGVAVGGLALSGIGGEIHSSALVYLGLGIDIIGSGVGLTIVEVPAEATNTRMIQRQAEPQPDALP